MSKEKFKKVLRLPDDIDDMYKIPGTEIGSGYWHKTIISLFRKHHYFIAKGGQFDESNPAEIGYYLKADPGEDGHPTLRLAAASGARIPKRFEVGDILSIPNPVVAKAVFLDAGFGKFLLETEEQKQKFVTWENQAKPWGWVYEEFINTPSDYFTSFRILADAHGQIHYSSLTRSDLLKSDTTFLNEWEPYNHPHPQVYEIIKLTHPRSPLYLNSRRIFSNYYQGGIRILLNGEKQINPSNRRVLIEHGINPDKPTAPGLMLEQASLIGIHNRKHTPDSGIDFLLDHDLNEVFIEANSGSMLNAEGLGLPKSSAEKRSRFVLMERIASFLD